MQILLGCALECGCACVRACGSVPYHKWHIVPVQLVPASGRANPIGPHSRRRCLLKRQYVKTRSGIRFLVAPLMMAGMFLNSACAIAEGPIPFNAMMQSSSYGPAIPPTPDAKETAGAQPSAAVSTSPARKAHMTTGGKVMTGVGIGLVGVGATLMGIAAQDKPGSMFHSGVEVIGYGGGAGFAGTGVVLIAFGVHRRAHN